MRQSKRKRKRPSWEQQNVGNYFKQQTADLVS